MAHTYTYIYVYVYACVHAGSLQSCTTLYNPMDYSLPCSSVHGILQARRLEWIAVSFSRGSSPPKDQTDICYVSCIGRWLLYHWSHIGNPDMCTHVYVCVCVCVCVCTLGYWYLIYTWTATSSIILPLDIWYTEKALLMQNINNRTKKQVCGPDLEK